MQQQQQQQHQNPQQFTSQKVVPGPTLLRRQASLDSSTAELKHAAFSDGEAERVSSSARLDKIALSPGHSGQVGEDLEHEC